MRAIAGTLWVGVLAGAVGALAGCGTSAHDQVQAKVQQFATASAAKDYKTICDQVLGPGLLAHLTTPGGIGCERGLRLALGSVQNPTLSIGKITVNGDHAAAITLTGAREQQGSLDAIELVQTSRGWRISSLSSPVPAGAPAGPSTSTSKSTSP